MERKPSRIEGEELERLESMAQAYVAGETYSLDDVAIRLARIDAHARARHEGEILPSDIANNLVDTSKV